MKKILSFIAFAFATCALYAQQSHVNIQYDPQRNTENITPFSAQVISPEVFDDHTVTFRVKAPDAHDVRLTGSMFVGQEARKQVPFTKGDDGIWTLTLGPLKPEIYLYYIIIDGVQNVDPNNTFTGHAAMPAFSMLFVHGDEPAWYDPKPDVPHGSITTHYYKSSVTGGLRDMMVYTPANYNPKKKYPVLYLMGGSGDLTETWVMHGRANWILDNIIAEGKAKEMIVVFPNDQMVTRNHPQHTELAFPLIEKELIQCVIPFVESHYSCIKDRHARALSGLSMGGRMSQYVGLRNLDVFGSVGLLSAAIDVSETPVLQEKDVNSKIDYLFVGGGTYETGFMARHERLHEELDKLGVKHEFYSGGGGAHDLVTWRHLLYFKFLPHLWQNLK
jgi:enterochelin esterase family protein